MFRIGDFSKIAQVSGRLLRYYDEIGLLSPEFTDPQTGYRYYSAQQLPRLNRILVLKELGLSLEQIAQLLDRNTSLDEIRGMLTLRKAQIEQSVQEEMERLRVVETRLQQIDMHGQILEPDVVLKSVPTQYFLALREVLPGMDAVRRLVQNIFTTVPKMTGHNSLGHIAVVTHSPIYDPEALDVEVGYLLTTKISKAIRLSEERVLTVRELHAVDTMATLAHEGRVSDLHQSYSMLGTWVERKNWHIIGVGREILIQLPKPDAEDDAVVEIQLPVNQDDKKLGLDFDVTSNSTL
jgi:DNA-binding transcriptional MerR regulator